MSDHFEQLWKFAPVVALLVIALWAGSKGLWFWGPGVKVMVKQLERERDEWRDLAMALLKRNGLELPPRPPEKEEK